MEIQNFILEYPNFVSRERCDFIKSYFDKADMAGFTVERTKTRVPRMEIDDKQLFSESVLMNKGSLRVDDIAILHGFQDAFWSMAYGPYAEEFSILSAFTGLKIRYIKIQKTRIGGGYHAWHCENLDAKYAGRALTFILYLNDVPDGGETEFLYYPRRIKAEAGKLILFPGGFTHTHRGNPPISNEKYILTGWVETE